MAPPGISVGYDKRSTDVYIGHCVARNNPGDPSNLTNHSGNGIVVANAENVIDRVLRGGRTTAGTCPARATAPSASGRGTATASIIQFCITHDNKSPGDDGGGFDLDGGATNSILQYNLSYNNDGPGYFLCQFPGARISRTTSFATTSARTTASRTTGAAASTSTPPVRTPRLPGLQQHRVQPVTAPAVGFGGLPMPDVVFRNNIFICSGDVICGRGRARTIRGQRLLVRGWTSDCRSTGIATLREWAEATGQEKIGDEIVGRYDRSQS